MNEKIASLRRMVQWGLDNGKSNMVVDLDVLAAILHLGPTLYCAHGVTDGDWCPDCNAEYKRARRDHDSESQNRT